ncbi:MAG: hypothetical protein PHY44_07820 [Lachnospiraceae bacterium]|nr:hypothetical protein [Lachnospiraceae bacterium]
MEKFIIRLVISSKYLNELNEKEIFQGLESGKFYVEFPTELEENEPLSDYIVACCETALIMRNPKYEIENAKDFNCELMKLGQSEKSFNLLINISYNNDQNEFHDIMVFKENKVEKMLYEFELMGDKTMFAI